MSSFVPTKEYLRGILLHYYFMKITAAEAHRILQQVYGEHALAEPTCREWFRHFKNGDYNIEDKERPGRPKKFEDSELEALLDEDPCQTLEELSASLNVGVTTVWDRIQKMGIIQKHGFWLPHELKPRDVERRFFLSQSNYLNASKGKAFCTESLLVMKNGFTTRIQLLVNTVHVVVNPCHQPQNQFQSKIFTV